MRRSPTIRISRASISRIWSFASPGGMATQDAVARRWKKVTGKAIIEGYGLSETSPIVTSNLVDLDEFSGSIGYPYPSTHISIRLETALLRRSASAANSVSRGRK